MRIKISRQRQAKFPAATLKALGVKPGGYLVLAHEAGDWKVKSSLVDFSKLGPLQSRIPEDFKPFDLKKWRDESKDYVRLRN
jgi:hypothetical protein